MKDAQGHGSDAHASGVNAIGKPSVYTWGKIGHGMHALMANGNLADQKGLVRPSQDGGRKRVYIGSYSHAGTGNAPSGWSQHKSVSGAKGYVERQLGKFWDPPSIGG